jgi:hypothetical protein
MAIWTILRSVLRCGRWSILWRVLWSIVRRRSRWGSLLKFDFNITNMRRWRAIAAVLGRGILRTVFGRWSRWSSLLDFCI